MPGSPIAERPGTQNLFATLRDKHLVPFGILIILPRGPYVIQKIAERIRPLYCYLSYVFHPGPPTVLNDIPLLAARRFVSFLNAVSPGRTSTPLLKLGVFPARFLPEKQLPESNAR
jgi:hypothetical protein